MGQSWSASPPEPLVNYWNTRTRQQPAGAGWGYTIPTNEAVSGGLGSSAQTYGDLFNSASGNWFGAADPSGFQKWYTGAVDPNFNLQNWATSPASGLTISRTPIPGTFTYNPDTGMVQGWQGHNTGFDAFMSNYGWMLPFAAAGGVALAAPAAGGAATANEAIAGLTGSGVATGDATSLGGILSGAGGGAGTGLTEDLTNTAGTIGDYGEGLTGQGAAGTSTYTTAGGTVDATGTNLGIDAGAGAVAGTGAGAGGGTFGTLSNIGSAVSGLGSAGQALAALQGSKLAANAAQNATNTQLGIFNTQNAQQAPYRQAGYESLQALLGGGNLPNTPDATGAYTGTTSYGGVPLGYFTHQFNAADLNANLAPNYEFMKEQGLGATANQLNRAGGYLSGNALQGINTFAQNYAQNAYQQAFQNYTANQSNIFNRLSSIAGLGQTANAQSAQLAGSIAPSVAQSQIGTGQAQAAGVIGVGNAISQGAGNALGWYALPQILDSMKTP